MTIAALEAALAPAFADAGAPAAALRGYALAKSVYMLHMVAATGGAACDPAFWLDSPAFVAYLLRPAFACAQVRGARGVSAPAEAPPLAEIDALCRRLAARCDANRKAVGLDAADELAEMGVVGFWDDSDFDEASDDGGEWSGDEDEDEDGGEDDGEWSDDEHAHGHSHAGGHAHGHSHSHAHGAGCSH